MPTRLIICETQPVTIEGFRALCSRRTGIELAKAVSSPARCGAAVREHPGCIILLDKAFGFRALADAISEIAEADPAASVVVWGLGMSEPEMVRYLRAGARGVLSKGNGIGTVLACIATVAAGGTWAEVQGRKPAARLSGRKARLTQREQQVLELVSHGLKNREVAVELGICPGTVKIHLKHIFEKTGVPDRHALALARLVQA